MEKVEILAPAGDWSALQTAIYNGANAVYLGMQGFNARAKAENFTKENIREVTRFAHLFGVRVFLTVNTLVKDDEIHDLLELVKSAVEAKVDAYLVQDFGVLSLLKHYFPNIVIHASTQMGIHNLYGAKMAEKLGITRIVLSREAKLEDIIEIKQNTNLEIEYFVQGALCVAFSGNCYLSSLETGESGNRGLCKQLCRLPYIANEGKIAGEEKYLLSPSDLCLMANLKKLIEAGVCCFKIEGRLRRSGYVGQAVSSYVKAIKMLEQNNELSEQFLQQEIFNLRKVFSRGEFNQDAYLNKGVPNKVINYNCNNHTGFYIGKVLEVKPFKDKLKQIIIQSEYSIQQNDGLKFFDDTKEISSLGVGNVEKIGKDKYMLYSTQFIKPNLKVHLIVDYNNEQKFIDIERKLNIDMQLNAKIGEPIQITAKYEDIAITQQSEFVCEQAKNSPTTAEQIAEQITKCGGTHFEINNLSINSENVFIPKSILNDIRRKALIELEEQIIQHNEKNITATFVDKPFELNLQEENKYQDIILFNEEQQPENNPNNLYVFAPTEFTKVKIVEQAKNYTNFGLNLPVMVNNHDLKIIQEIIDAIPNMVLVANNLYGLYWQDREIIAGTSLNVYNSYTQNFLQQLGCYACVLSFEQKMQNVTENNKLFTYTGQPALMTFAHCPYKTVFGNDCSKCSFTNNLSYTNQHGKEYKIRRTRISQCYFELVYNRVRENKSAHNFIDIRK